MHAWGSEGGCGSERRLSLKWLCLERGGGNEREKTEMLFSSSGWRTVAVPTVPWLMESVLIIIYVPFIQMEYKGKYKQWVELSQSNKERISFCLSISFCINSQHEKQSKEKKKEMRKKEMLRIPLHEIILESKGDIATSNNGSIREELMYRY